MNFLVNKTYWYVQANCSAYKKLFFRMMILYTNFRSQTQANQKSLPNNNKKSLPKLVNLRLFSCAGSGSSYNFSKRSKEPGSLSRNKEKVTRVRSRARGRGSSGSSSYVVLFVYLFDSPKIPRN